jgi:hypothetical protein
MISIEKPGTPEEILHFGTKGMRWGVRNDRTSSGGRAGGRSGGGGALSVAKKIGTKAGDFGFEVAANTNFMTRHIAEQASSRTRKDLPGIKAKHGDYGKLTNRAKHPFSPEAKAYRADVKKAYLKHLEETANEIGNFSGTKRYTVKKDDGTPNTSKYFWHISTEHAKAIKQAATSDETFRVQPIFDDEGYIIDIKIVDDSVAQTMDLGVNFLSHMGIVV